MKKGFIPSWYVSFGAIILAFLLTFAFYAYTSYVQQDAIRKVESRHLPSLAGQDLRGILNTEVAEIKLFERIIGAAETGEWSKPAVSIQATVDSALRRRGCPDCQWYLRIWDDQGKQVHIWPNDANPDRLKTVYLEIPLTEFKRYEQQMMHQLMQDKDAWVIEDMTGYWLARRRMYLAYQRLPTSHGYILLEYSAGKKGQEMAT